jgi:iron-sulfur cluster insertion protein
MFNLTDKAKEQVNSLIQEHNKKLRVYIEGGGCSGFQYGFELEDTVNDDDIELNNVIVDSMSLQYLMGAEIDYKTDMFSAQFTITNPNASATCGCGHSFTV